MLALSRDDRWTTRSAGGMARPRYVVKRMLPDRLTIPVNEEGGSACLGVVDRNAAQAVTWMHSCDSDDKKKTSCVDDDLDPESVRRAAERNGLPVDGITKVSALLSANQPGFLFQNKGVLGNTTRCPSERHGGDPSSDGGG
jgi:hypothetical protein